MTDARDPPPSPHPPGSIGWVKHLARHMTGQSVKAMSAPAGRGRQSVRLLLEDDSTVIATRRAQPERTAREAALLHRLHQAGAPVPRMIGEHGGLMILADAGRNRLSHAFAQAPTVARQAELAAAAIGGLDACRTALDTLPVEARPKLVGLGQGLRWAEAYVAGPVFLSGDLAIDPPDLEPDALAQALAHPPERLTRWNARTGLAAVQADGRVLWHGWDVAGQRGGVEDIAFLVADEWWPLSPSATETLLADQVPGPRRPLVMRLAVLVAANRMGARLMRIRSDGVDGDADHARRLDLPSTAPDVVTAHAETMAEIAAADPLTAGFAPWFRAAAGRLADMAVPV